MFILAKIKRNHLVAICVLAVLALSLGYVSAASRPSNTKPGSNLAQRVAQRKQERQIKLAGPERQRIESQCTFAQSKLRTLSDSYTDSVNQRDSVYRTIDAKLWIIIGSLKLINEDTFDLERQRIKYAKKVKAFDNSAAQFRQTIDDIMAMNCKADPVGFLALVETARLYNARVRGSFDDIRSYLIDQVKPTITQHASDLKLKTTTE